MSATLLPIFSKLSSYEKDSRLEASANLIGTLQDSPADLDYTLRRLIRGLSSSVDSSRLGFAVALTEVLSRNSLLEPSKVIPQILTPRPGGSSFKGREERDFFFSRLFALESLIQSGFIFLPSSTLQDWETVLDEILVLLSAKSWLAESSGLLLCNGSRGLTGAKGIKWREGGLKSLVSRCFEERKAWSREKLALAILLLMSDVKVDASSILNPHFHGSTPFSPDNLETLARLLLKGSASESEQSSAQGQASGQLHYVWAEILNAYGLNESTRSKGEHAKLVSRLPLKTLLQRTLVDGLLSTQSSLLHKFEGMLLFEQVLLRLPALANRSRKELEGILPVLFSQNLLRTWINHLAAKDRNLHKVSLKIATTLSTIVKEHPSLAAPILLNGFLSSPDGILFDKLSRTKTVETTASNLEGESLGQYVKFLEKVYTAPDVQEAGDEGQEKDEDAMEEDEKTEGNPDPRATKERTWALDQLLFLIRKRTSAGVKIEGSEWVVEILEFLAFHGFFEVTSDKAKTKFSRPTPPLTADMKQAARNRFYSCIADLHTRRHAAAAGDVSSESWTATGLQIISNTRKTKFVNLVHSPDEEAQQVAKDISKSLSASSQTQFPVAPLISFSEALQLLSYDEESDAAEISESLRDATALLGADAQNAGRSEEEGEEGEAAEPVAVLIDVLVSSLQRPSALLKATAEHVFQSVSKELSEQSMEVLLDPLSIGGDDEDDVGLATAEGDESESGEDDNADSDEESEEDVEVDQELRDAVAKAIASSGLGAGDEADEEDEDEDAEEEQEEEPLDDEQMMALDDQLAEIFRQRKATSGAAKEDSHFQTRLLDLVEILAKQKPANPLFVFAIPRLFRLAHQTGRSNDEVATKAARVLREATGKRKEPVDTQIDLDIFSAVDSLGQLHKLARRSIRSELGALWNQCSLYISRIVLAKEDSSEAVVAVYCASLDDYMMRKASAFPQKYIIDFLKRFPEAAVKLFDTLANYAKGTAQVNAFRRIQAIEMMSTLLISANGLDAKSKPDLLPALQESQRAVISVFRTATAEPESTLSADRLKETTKFLLSAIRISKQTHPDQVASLWGNGDFPAVFTEIQNHPRYKASSGLHAMFRQASALIGVEGGEKEGSKGGKATGKRKAREEEKEQGASGGSGKASAQEDKSKAKKKKRSSLS